MHSILKRAAGAAIILAGFSQAPAAAEDCKPLTRLASVDLVPGADKRQEFVPVTLAGKDKLMLLDTGGVYAMISPSAAQELGLEGNTGNVELFDVAGRKSDLYAAASFALGRLKMDRMPFAITDGAKVSDDPRIAGILGPDLFKHYELDIDFGANKLSVFSQDHCEGKVIYWPATAVAVVPMRVYGSGHIIVPVQLDGKEVLATLDTGAWNTTLTQRIAESQYGLKMGSADTPQSGALEGRAASHTYSHVFASLTFEGITVNHPHVEIIPDMTHDLLANTPPDTGTRLRPVEAKEFDSSMLIGMNILRHFHIFISYKENKLYVTPADAPAAPPSAPTQ
ncbi:MAG: pepsin/retropepsin-like aspartic protease family protein [Rhizomicrobium sp.]